MMLTKSLRVSLMMVPKNVEEYASQFGDAGKAWLSGVSCAPRFPQYGDMVCDEHGVATIIQKYEHIAPVHDGDGTLTRPLKLSPDGIKDYVIFLKLWMLIMLAIMPLRILLYFILVLMLKNVFLLILYLSLLFVATSLILSP